jgi:hypothetical protein
MTRYSICLLPVLPVPQRLSLSHGDNFFSDSCGREKIPYMGIDVSTQETGSTGSKVKKVLVTYHDLYVYRLLPVSQNTGSSLVVNP